MGTSPSAFLRTSPMLSRSTRALNFLRVLIGSSMGTFSRLQRALGGHGYPPIPKGATYCFCSLGPPLLGLGLA
eukprot:3973869-Pyramimonas_sp.AAC.1